MADRRMITRKVTDDDHFLGLSSSAQALYLHLSVSADDDGFNNQVAVAMFRAHASIQDLEALLKARYIYQFDNGVIVIKHWRMANALRKDRYTPTVFKEEMARLELKENGAYTWVPDGCQMDAKRVPNGCLSIDKVSIDKNSIDKVSIEEYEEEAPGKPAQTPKRFTKPTIEEVKAYCQERGGKVDPDRFYAYYEANGWQVGKRSMKDWRAAVRYWETDQAKQPAQQQRKGNYFQQTGTAPVVLTDKTDISEEEEEELARMLRGGGC